MTAGKTTALTRWTFVGKVMSLLFNVLSRLVTAFLPRSFGFHSRLLPLSSPQPPEGAREHPSGSSPPPPLVLQVPPPWGKNSSPPSAPQGPTSPAPFPPCPPLPPLPLAHSAPDTRASSLFLPYTRHSPAPGPLHGLCPLPGMPFPRPSVALPLASLKCQL